MSKIQLQYSLSKAELIGTSKFFRSKQYSELDKFYSMGMDLQGLEDVFRVRYSSVSQRVHFSESSLYYWEKKQNFLAASECCLHSKICQINEIMIVKKNK